MVNLCPENHQSKTLILVLDYTREILNHLKRNLEGLGQKAPHYPYPKRASELLHISDFTQTTTRTSASTSCNMHITPIFGRLVARSHSPFRTACTNQLRSPGRSSAYILHSLPQNHQHRSFSHSKASSMSSAVAQDEMVGLGGTTDLPTRNGNHEMPQTAWSGPGPAAFDFRSTSPTTPPGTKY